MKRLSLILVVGFLLASGTALTGCSDDDNAGATCGNGRIDPGEECDGTNLRGYQCSDQGFLGGTLACNPPGTENECHYDTSRCTSPECGNGVREPGEECDGYDMAAQTCQTLGHDAGMLKCKGPDSDQPCTFDTSECLDSPYCGDGVVDTEEGEQCDGASMNEQSCTTLGFLGGQLQCTDDCQFDTSGCVQPECGNGIREADEICDGSDLAGESCITKGFIEGTLSCLADCSDFDTSNCSGTPECGNDIAEGLEACDGTDLKGNTCLDQGFVEGDLACQEDCSGFDTSNCSGTLSCNVDFLLGTLTSGQTQTVSGDISQATDDTTVSGCNNLPFGQKDVVVMLSLPGPGNLQVDYSFPSAQQGFAMNYIGLYHAGAGDCNAEEVTCEQTMDASGTLTYEDLDAGAYFLILEEGMPQGGSDYSLDIVYSAPEDCSNGVDDDGDGLVDCADSLDCCQDASCSNDSACDGFDGEPCTTDSDCLGGKCMTESGYGMPAGLCTRLCNGPGDCASGFGCFTWNPTNEQVCVPLCPSGSSSDCRTGYLCAGTSNFVCSPDCTDDSECPDTGTCNPWSGLCETVGSGAEDGAACTAATDCESGICITQAPDGYCTSVCSLAAQDCPAGGVCVNYLNNTGDMGYCFVGCSQTSECRNGYTCQANSINPPPNDDICSW